MSAGWEVGDLARIAIDGAIECERVVHTGESSPPKNSIRRVNHVSTTHMIYGSRCNCVNLSFDGGGNAVAQRCIKIKPDTEPCEEEFTTLIKRGRKVQA